MEKILLIDNKEYNLSFDLSTLMEVEDTFDKPYHEIMSEIGKPDCSFMKRVKFVHAILSACNDDMPTVKLLARSFKNLADFTRAINEIGKHSTRFFDVSNIAEAHVPTSGEDGKENP